MNKNVYRIVFNAARGMRMVVQETARGVGKGAARSTAGAAVGLFGTLVAIGANGQIAADPNAPGNQRPTVLVAPNGVPLVNIQAPSAAGVSRNTYRQFDVDGKGVILNNSRTNVQSQTGGWVQGNPWLAGGPARIILNEVNSSNPSYLRGHVEVAGQRAEVIIANPSGISVDGGSFINANGVTLTTGAPQFNSAGSLESFLVRGGTVSVEGAGMDASKADYAAILSRAVQVNAGIWAKELKVVAGTNQVAADAGQTTPIAGNGPAPAYALDVAHLGGMYANKIVLVGTEAGVGVRNAGSIGAGAGELVVTSAGRLENRGTLEAARVQLTSANELDNSGGTIRQTGTNTATISAPNLSNRNGGVIGAEPVPATAPGSNLGSGNLSNTGSGSSGGSTDQGAAPSPTTSTTETNTNSQPGGAAPPSAPSAPLAPGLITAGDTVRNDGGRIYVGGNITLQTPQIDNSGGKLSVNELNVSGARFTNVGGTLNVRDRFNAKVGDFDNSGGTLQAGVLDIRSDNSLSNISGKLLATNGDADLQAGGVLDNTDGVIASSNDLRLKAGSVRNDVTQARAASGGALLRAGRDLDVTSGGALSNAGAISAGRNATLIASTYAGSTTSTLGAGLDDDGKPGQQLGELRVTTNGVLIAQGTQLASGNIVDQGAQLDLTNGKVQAQNIALAATSGNVTTRAATVEALATLSVAASTNSSQALDNQGGSLRAERLDLKAANIDNSAGGRIAQTGSSALQIDTGKLDNHADGQIVQARALTVNASSIDNRQGAIASRAGDLQLKVTNGLENQKGLIVSEAGALNVSAASIGNGAGKIASQGGALALSGGPLDNQAGEIFSKGGALRIDAGDLNNQEGVIAGEGGNTVLNASSINNSKGTIASETDELQVKVGNGLVNRDGRIIGQVGAVTVSAGSIDNHTGQISSEAGPLTLRSGQLGNQSGQLVSKGGALRIEASDLNNREGRIVGNGGSTVVNAGSVDNSKGTIGSKIDALQLNVTNGLNNREGRVIAQAGALTVSAANTDNSDGQIASEGGSLSLSGGALNNQSGQISSKGGDLRVGSADLDNQEGLIVSDGGDTLVNASSVNNNKGIVASKTGKLNLRSTGPVTNQGGALQAIDGEVAIVSANGFDNSQQGLVAGRQVNLDTQGAALDNRLSGLIGGKQGVRIDSGTLLNDGGLIQAGQTLDVDTHGQNLSNTQSASYGNGTQQPQSGGLLSSGTLTLNAANVDNQGGLIAATESLQAKTTGLTNARGTVASTGDLTWSAATGAINNVDGKINAAKSIDLSAVSIDNTRALMRANQSLTLTAASVINRDTLGEDKGMEGNDVRIATARLDNTRGAIRSNNSSSVVASDAIDNRDGLMSSRGALSLSDPNANKSLGIINTGGQLLANTDLTLNAATFSGDGTLTAGRDLGIALTQDVVNNLDLSTGGNLRYATTGKFTNKAKLIAGKQLEVVGSDVTNVVTGEMSGTDTRVIASGALVNRGLIDSANRTDIDAGTVDNATGRIYGDSISIAAQNLFNTDRAVIASRMGDVDLGIAQKLENRDESLIHSGNFLAIGGFLDEYRTAQGRAGHVVNEASIIESAGDMHLGAQQLDNLNKGFRTQEVTTSEDVSENYVARTQTSQRYRPDELGQCFRCQSNQLDSGSESSPRAEIVVPSAQYPFEKGYQRHPYALPGAGGDYANDDLVWALFEVTPGDTAALTPKLRAYNQDFMARASRDRVEITVTNRQTTQTKIADPGIGGRITSGGDMTLDIGAGRNSNSQVIAGGDLRGSADSLVNEEVTGQREVRERSNWKSYTIEYSPYGRPKNVSTGTDEKVMEKTSIKLSNGNVQHNLNAGTVASPPDAAAIGQANAPAGAPGAANAVGSRASVVDVPLNVDAVADAGTNVNADIATSGKTNVSASGLSLQSTRHALERPVSRMRKGCRSPAQAPAHVRLWGLVQRAEHACCPCLGF